MKTRHKKLAIAAGVLCAIGAAAALVMNAFQSNLVFFFSPSQIAANEAPRDRNFRIPENLPPGPLGSLTGNRVIQVSSMRPGLSDGVSGAVSGGAIRWREYVETSASVLATFDNGDPALTEKGNVLYLACWADAGLLAEVLELATKKADVPTLRVPDTIRIRRRGDLVFAFNYGMEDWTLPEGADPVLGESVLKPQAVAAWRG